MTVAAAIDHRARAERLRAVMGELSKVDDDSLENADVKIEDARGRKHPRPKVPYRYVLVTYDGDRTWLEFHETLEEAEAGAAALGGGDYPWAPGYVYDLDSEAVYDVALTATLHELLPPGPCKVCGRPFDDHTYGRGLTPPKVPYEDHLYERSNPTHGRIPNPEMRHHLALWFTPQAIRDHFDGETGSVAAWVAKADAEDLAAVGEMCLQDDRLYEAFRTVLRDAIEDEL